MSGDRRTAGAVEMICELLADTEAVVLPRRKLTEIWRKADVASLAKAWMADPPVAEDRDLLAEVMQTQRGRLSKGQAMELQLTLEDVGIHCEPPLGRLSSMSDTVRIYRKWRDSGLVRPRRQAAPL